MRKKYEAVNRKFEIIGEAARHLSPEVRQALPEVPWKLITAMRNILIHDYDDVDLDVVWDTVQRDVPSLIERLESHLAKDTGDAGGSGNS
ncbi:MAG: HepT-like ribonuclease domain-containing protein [Verrucomicrobiota bacterium]